MSVQTIAAGGTPAHKHTATHPVHGDLTFTFRSPKAPMLLAHSVATDEQLGGRPRQDLSWETVLLAEALAALTDSLLIDLPVLRTEIDDDAQDDATRAVRIFYDPADEDDTSFLIAVWLAFREWRTGLLASYKEVKAAVGEASGETPSPASAGASSGS